MFIVRRPKQTASSGGATPNNAAPTELHLACNTGSINMPRRWRWVCAFSYELPIQPAAKSGCSLPITGRLHWSQVIIFPALNGSRGRCFAHQPLKLKLNYEY
jgi:hypothetical protein